MGYSGGKPVHKSKEGPWRLYNHREREVVLNLQAVLKEGDALNFCGYET